jgi:hypothetical protein
MAQCKYLVVSLAFTNDKGYVVQYTAQRDKTAIGKDANEYLSYLGQQGWELVLSYPLPMAVSTSTDVGWRERVAASNVGMVFKRAV